MLKSINDFTSINQQIVKSTPNDLTVKKELPATATNLIIITTRTSCIYFSVKNNQGEWTEASDVSRIF